MSGIPCESVIVRATAPSRHSGTGKRRPVLRPGPTRMGGAPAAATTESRVRRRRRAAVETCSPPRNGRPALPGLAAAEAAPAGRRRDPGTGTKRLAGESNSAPLSGTPPPGGETDAELSGPGPRDERDSGVRKNRLPRITSPEEAPGKRNAESDRRLPRRSSRRAHRQSFLVDLALGAQDLHEFFEVHVGPSLERPQRLLAFGPLHRVGEESPDGRVQALAARGAEDSEATRQVGRDPADGESGGDLGGENLPRAVRRPGTVPRPRTATPSSAETEPGVERNAGEGNRSGGPGARSGPPARTRWPGAPGDGQAGRFRPRATSIGPSVQIHSTSKPAVRRASRSASRGK